WYMKEAVRRKESTNEQLAVEKEPASTSSTSTSGSELEPARFSPNAQAGFEASPASKDLFRELPSSSSTNSKEQPLASEEFSFSDPFLVEPIQTKPEESITDSTGHEIWAPTHGEDQFQQEETQQTVTGELTEATPKAWLLELQAHRAEIYLGVAAILLVIVLVGWGAPKIPVVNSSRTNISAAPQLTAFEKLLVATGLADAPEVPHVYL